MPRKGRKSKVYDDKALALALAHQTKTTAQIAREFGLSQSYVALLRGGRYRPRLQRLIRAIRQDADDDLDEQARLRVRALLLPHIRLGLVGTPGVARRCREYLLDRYLLPYVGVNRRCNPDGSMAVRSGPPAAGTGPAGLRGGRYRKRFYDEDALVLDLAEERLSLRAIARKHKLSHPFVGCIRRGTERPDLKPRIDQLRWAIEDESSHTTSPWFKLLAAKEIQCGMKEGYNALLCRHYVLDRFLLRQRVSPAAVSPSGVNPSAVSPSAVNSAPNDPGPNCPGSNAPASNCPPPALCRGRP